MSDGGNSGPEISRRHFHNGVVPFEHLGATGKHRIEAKEAVRSIYLTHDVDEAAVLLDNAGRPAPATKSSRSAPWPKP